MQGTATVSQPVTGRRDGMEGIGWATAPPRLGGLPKYLPKPVGGEVTLRFMILLFFPLAPAVVGDTLAACCRAQLAVIVTFGHHDLPAPPAVQLCLLPLLLPAPANWLAFCPGALQLPVPISSFLIQATDGGMCVPLYLGALYTGTEPHSGSSTPGQGAPLLAYAVVGTPWRQRERGTEGRRERERGEDQEQEGCTDASGLGDGDQGPPTRVREREDARAVV